MRGEIACLAGQREGAQKALDAACQEIEAVALDGRWLLIHDTEALAERIGSL
jgi:hypothetical protein